MPISSKVLWLSVLVACVSGSIAIAVIERWMAIRYPLPILSAWPLWLRPGQAGWTLLNIATCLGLLVLMAWQMLPFFVGLPVIWLHGVLTCVIERRHRWESPPPPPAAPGDEEPVPVE